MITQYTTPAKYTPIDYGASEDLWKAVAIKQEAYDKVSQELKDTQTFIDKIQTPSIRDREFLDRQSTAMRDLASKYAKEDLADRFVQSKMQSDLANIQLGKIRNIEDNARRLDEYSKLKDKLRYEGKLFSALDSFDPRQYSTIDSGTFTGSPEASLDVDKKVSDYFKGTDISRVSDKGAFFQIDIDENKKQNVATQNAFDLASSPEGDQIFRMHVANSYNPITGERFKSVDEYVNYVYDQGDHDSLKDAEVDSRKSAAEDYINHIGSGIVRTQIMLKHAGDERGLKDQSLQQPKTSMTPLVQGLVEKKAANIQQGLDGAEVSISYPGGFLKYLYKDNESNDVKGGYVMNNLEQATIVPATLHGQDQEKALRAYDIVNRISSMSKNLSNMLPQDIKLISTGLFGQSNVATGTSSDPNTKLSDIFIGKNDLVKKLNAKGIHTRGDLVKRVGNDIAALRYQAKQLGYDVLDVNSIDAIKNSIDDGMGKILKNITSAVFIPSDPSQGGTNISIGNYGKGDNRLVEKATMMVKKSVLENALKKSGSKYDLDAFMKATGANEEIRKNGDKEETWYVMPYYGSVKLSKAGMQKIDWEKLRAEGAATPDDYNLNQQYYNVGPAASLFNTVE
jgi:hypothetical protein